MAMGLGLGYWYQIRNTDDRGRALYLRHYSARNYADGRRRSGYIGPGRHLALMTADSRALFVWTKPEFRRDGQQGVCCSIFRNESGVRSSDLIREAMDLAWVRWPGERLFTYVNAAKIRSTNPGYCFLMAGWRKCGMSKGGLILLEVFP